ncbi:hypothetical protein Goari_019301, partial [Gossypium aridum]|nr:hypothetical protein [Gossypium aridum]
MKVISAPIHENQDWKHWLAETFNIYNTYQCTCLAVSFWAIWHNRNNFFHEGIWQRTCALYYRTKHTRRSIGKQAQYKGSP